MRCHSRKKEQREEWLRSGKRSVPEMERGRGMKSSGGCGGFAARGEGL